MALHFFFSLVSLYDLQFGLSQRFAWTASVQTRTKQEFEMRFIYSQ